MQMLAVILVCELDLYIHVSPMEVVVSAATAELVVVVVVKKIVINANVVIK